jgi:peroxiredoxin
MQAELAEHGVSVVALSKDSVADAARHKTRDGLRFTLLSDPDLTVIKQYGVEHHKALEFSTVSFSLFGIPLALVPSVKKMAIPTTLLLDEQGVIRWIDQADDYRLRSNEERVLEAVRAAFGQR